MKYTLIYKILLINFIFTLSLYSDVNVYEHADKVDSNVKNNRALLGEWETDGDQLAERNYSKIRTSGIVKISSGDSRDLYTLKINDKVHNAIKWDIKMNNYTSVYVKLRTLTEIKGKKVYTNRYIQYYPRDDSKTQGLIKQGYIRIGIGKNINDKKWHTIRRDLIKDLNTYDPASKLISIEAFLVRGEAELDNIETMSYRQYEDGTGIKQFHSSYIHNTDTINHVEIKNWKAYDGQSNASFKSVYDRTLEKKVVHLSGNGIKTGFKLKPFFDKKKYTTIQWDMKYNERFIVYIKVNTKRGIRYLVYRPDDIKIEHPAYLTISLGNIAMNDKWHTFTRDLNKDLKKFEKDNSITSVIQFFIRGTGYINNVFLLKDTKISSDPIYAHKHYYMETSALLLGDHQVYTLRLAEHHTGEDNVSEAIVLYQKHTDEQKWKEKILIRSEKNVNMLTSNLSPIMLDGKKVENKIIVRIKRRIKRGTSFIPSTTMYIYDLEKETLSAPLELNFPDLTAVTYGNTLITPQGRILVAGYTSGDISKVFIYRSNEEFTFDKKTYTMEKIKTFKDNNETFKEPVLSYSFGKLTVAIRKDILWFDQKENNAEEYPCCEKTKNTNGEIYYTSDKEGGNENTIWIKNVLPGARQIHGMFVPPYQGEENYLMIASDGGNRKKMFTLNLGKNTTLDGIKEESNYHDAFTISHPKGGGYPGFIRNKGEESDAIIIYWEETCDGRRTNIKRTHIVRKNI